MKKIFGIGLMILGILNIVACSTYWVLHPEFTEMEVANKMWPNALIGFILAVWGFYLFLKSKVEK